MPKVTPSAITEVKAALAVYIAEVEAAPLQPATMRTYCHHARQFVRWLNGEFEPGAAVPRR